MLTLRGLVLKSTIGFSGLVHEETHLSASNFIQSYLLNARE